MAKDADEVAVTEQAPIAPEHWAAFCDAFSRRHRGWLSSLYLRGPSSERTGVLAEDTPLRGLAVDPRRDVLDLLISTGKDRQPFTHAVRAVTALVPLSMPDGADAGLRVDAAEGRSTLLRFRPGVRSEALDGLAPGERL